MSLWIKIKHMETPIDHAPACIRFVRKNGSGHCTFPSRITIPRQKRVNLSRRLWHYRANSFSKLIDCEATKALYRVCQQTIILVVCKIMCGKKGQDKDRRKIFQCYVIQGVGMLKFVMRQGRWFQGWFCKPRVCD